MEKSKQKAHGGNGAADAVDNDVELEGVEKNPSESPADGGAGDEGVQAAEGPDEASGELNQALLDVERHREAMLRMQAEMENLRKRMAREMDKARKFAVERLMKDLLQVRDSLERGLEIDDQTATVESLKEGKTLTLKMLNKVMEDHGLEVVDPIGAPFDPECHEAMTTAPSQEHEENTVLEVLQKGFKLNDRLIRPAMVVVSTKPD